MLGKLAEWFYDPVVFWGVPFVLLAVWAAIIRAYGWVQRKKPRA